MGRIKRRVGFKTLGCRLNQFETDALASRFTNLGYEVVGESKDTDVFIVNSCTVTNQSDQKSRYVVNHALKNGHNGLMIITGCMANHHKAMLEQKYPNAYVVENNQKSVIPQLVEAHYNKEILPANPDESDVFNYAPANATFHTRSMIKIQDGCDNFCTFCIIPKVRGRAVSRPVNDILDNIKQVVGFGYKEVVLTGVNISRYKFESVSFSGLLKQIVDLPHDFRVRISSIEPDGFDEDFYVLLSHPKVMPHLHLCLQSASEQVLLKMRRMYTYRSYQNIIERIRAINPLFNITTDIIVGFPGETEADFKSSLEAVEKLQLGHVHAFKYSKRNGTRAERMAEQVPEKLKNERSAQVRELAMRVQIQYREQLIGIEQEVVVERVKDGVASGYGNYYVPVRIYNSKLTKNSVCKVKLVELVKEGEEMVFVGVC